MDLFLDNLYCFDSRDGHEIEKYKVKSR